VDENLYITVFSRQHRFYINVRVSFIGDRLLGSVVCLKRLVGAVYPQWIGHGDLHDPPDLNPLDFWLWEFLKTSVYSELIGDLEVSLHRV
jgi:hypothetical protein